MKKATKIFICLLSVVLLIFFTFWIFGDKLAEPLYNYGLISDSAYCKSRGGRIYISSINADKERTCEIEYNDVGKECNDNNNCEGRCLIGDIDSRKYLQKKLLELYEDKKIESLEISVDEFKQKAKIETELKGYCGSKFYYDCNEPEIVIKNNIIRPGNNWGCGGHYE